MVGRLNPPKEFKGRDRTAQRRSATVWSTGQTDPSRLPTVCLVFTDTRVEIGRDQDRDRPPTPPPQTYRRTDDHDVRHPDPRDYQRFLLLKKVYTR